MAFLEVNRKKNYYEVFGEHSDEAILILHGGPGASCLDFEGQARLISRHIMVVTADQLGVLRSDALDNDDDYGMQYQIEIFEELRKQLKVKRWILIGHSYGGMLACKYIQMYTEYIKGVILECPSLYFEYSAKSVARFLKDYFKKNGIDEGVIISDKIEQTTYGDKDSKIFSDLINMLQLIKDEKIANYLHNISYEEYSKSMNLENITPDMWGKSEIHMQKLIDDKDIFDNYLPVLKNFKGFKLLLTASYDPVCRDEQLEYCKSQIAEMKIVNFEHSGHFPRVEEKDKYTNTIINFIKNN